MIGKTVGPYQVVEKVGEGGMGEIYRARDLRLNRDVALKILPESFASDSDRVARFTREAQALAALNHPHIAQIYGVEDRALVMELVEGPTLADRLKGGPFEWREAVTLARDIAEAMSVAHERGIVHRDLKPANIKVTPGGSVKVLDFGLAKPMDVSGGAGDNRLLDSPTIASPAMTAAGMLLGTAPYMSPEQARGMEVDRRSDVWAFGCVLYELLTGEQAFPGTTVSDTVAAILRGEPDWRRIPPQVPESCVRLLQRCLDKDRNRRLADLHDAALDLDDCLTTRTAIPAAPARRVMRSTLLAIAGVMVGVAAGTSIALWSPFSTALDTARLTFTMPDDIMLPSGGGALYMSFSPDGRQLFFPAERRGIASAIFRISLDSFGVDELPGTAGFDDPAMSPDGRSLFVNRGDQIFKFPLDGSKPIEIAGAIGGRALPSEDGRIYIPTETASTLDVIPDHGGTMARIFDASLGLAQPLPLSNGVVLAMKIQGEEIVAYNPVDRTMTPLVRGRSPQMTSTGHLVFFRDGSLWAVRMKDAFTVVGDPQPMEAGVASNPSAAYGVAHYAISRTGHLAFVPAAVPPAHRLVWVSRDRGASTPAFPEASDFEMVRLSPDGKRAAVVERNGISILDLTRGTRVRLSSEGYLKRRPVWKADGQTIAYQSRGDIFEQAVDGSAAPTALFAGEASQFPDSWSPDGTTLLFNEGGPTRDLFALVNGKKQTVIATPANERAGMFHPDGQWFAYTSNDSGRDEVYLQRWPPRGGKIAVSTRGGHTPLWSRDGREIFYREGAQLVAVRFDPANASLSRPQALFATGSFLTDDNIHRFDVAADGRFLMIESDTAQRRDEIRVILNWTEEVKRKVP